MELLDISGRTNLISHSKVLLREGSVASKYGKFATRWLAGVYSELCALDALGAGYTPMNSQGQRARSLKEKSRGNPCILGNDKSLNPPVESVRVVVVQRSKARHALLYALVRRIEFLPRCVALRNYDRIEANKFTAKFFREETATATVVFVLSLA